MFDLTKFGLPTKYALVGLAVGVVWLVIERAIGYQSGLGPLPTILAFVLGGYAGGWIRQSHGEDD